MRYFIDNKNEIEKGCVLDSEEKIKLILSIGLLNYKICIYNICVLYFFKLFKFFDFVFLFVKWEYLCFYRKLM